MSLAAPLTIVKVELELLFPALSSFPPLIVTRLTASVYDPAAKVELGKVMFTELPAIKLPVQL